MNTCNETRYRKQHIGNQSELEPHSGSMNLKNSNQFVLPKINKFSSQQRIKPSSGVPTNIISSQGSVDFYLTANHGYINKLILEFELAITTAPVSINPFYIIQRVEFMDCKGSVAQTFYSDNLLFEKVHQSLEEHERIKANENLDSSYVAQSLAVGNHRIQIKLPSYIDNTHVKLSSLKNKQLVRVYFSNIGITAGSVANVAVNLFDIIAHGYDMEGWLEQSETQKKGNSNLLYRTLSPIRGASSTLALAPSQQYDIKLSSATGYSAYMLFVVRPAPIDNTNFNTFQALDKYELYDSGMQLIGLTVSQEQSRELSLNFIGDILTKFPNLYTLPYAVDMELAKSGNATGGYIFTGFETLRIYTPSTLVAGNFTIDVYTYDYNLVQSNMGSIEFNK